MSSEEEYKPFYSLAYLSVFGCSAVEQIKIASETGYDAVGLRLVAHKNAGDTALFSSQASSSILEVLRETNIKVADVELFAIDDHFQEKDFDFHLEKAASLGAARVISSVWFEKECSLNFIADSFALLCEKAARYEIAVALEFPTFSSLKTLDSCLEVLKKAQQDNAELLLDMLYVYLNKIEAEILLSLPSQWVKFLHICDVAATLQQEEQSVRYAARNQRLYAGEGDVDFEQIICSLATPEYYALEIPHKERCRLLGYREHAQNCLNTAKKTLQSLKGKQKLSS